MPIYEYKCEICQQIFENFVFNSADKEKEIRCPKCGDKHVRPVVSMATGLLGTRCAKTSAGFS
jgi:putative FmdB family regulatory protein